MTSLEKCRLYNREHGGSRFHRVLWWLGIPLPPAQLMSSLVNMMINSSLIFMFFCAINLKKMLAGDWSNISLPIEIAVMMSQTGGFLMALVQRHDRLKMNLPPWRDYGRDLH